MSDKITVTRVGDDINAEGNTVDDTMTLRDNGDAKFIIGDGGRGKDRIAVCGGDKVTLRQSDTTNVPDGNKDLSMTHKYFIIWTPCLLIGKVKPSFLC